MSDQREMTLDEYLESKLPDFHLARRQLQELRAERDALVNRVDFLNQQNSAQQEQNDELAAHVAACHALMEEMPRRSLAWQVNAMVDLKAEAPKARLKALWQAEVLEEAGRYVRCEEDAALLRINAAELRRQAEENSNG